MKRRAIYLTAIAAMICMLFTIMTGCGRDKDNAVFAKALVYSDDMDMTTTYICDKEWDKKVTEISIPDTDINVNCSVYSDDKEECSGYVRADVRWGISFHDGDEDGAIAEDFSFSEIEVTWSDGTKELVNIGDITVAALGGEVYETYIGLEGMGSAGITVDAKSTVTLEPLPCGQQITEFYDKVFINDVTIADMLDGKSITLDEGDQLTVQTAIDEASQSQYQQVKVLLIFRTVPERYPDEESFIAIGLHAEKGLEEL